MLGESMAYNVISKINVRSKILHRKSKYLTPNLCHVLCNTLMQPYLDCACSVWCPYLSKKLKDKFKLHKISAFLCVNSWTKCYIYLKREFETINWFVIKERYNQCVNSIAFKYFDNQ